MKHGLWPIILNMVPTLVLSSNDHSTREDPLAYDPRLEVIHLYQRQFPVGIAVSKSGRKFSSFPAGFDELNLNNGHNAAYQVAELTSFDRETPYPNASYNNPPGGAVDTSGPVPVTKGLSHYLLSVQSVVIDTNDVLWIIDAGRVRYRGVLLAPQPGGPKLVSVDLTTNIVTRTYTFPTSVATLTSYLNEPLIDTVNGFAFIGDVSPEQNNAIIVLNLRTGRSWRTLERDPSVTAIPEFLPFVYGDPAYEVRRNSAGQIVGAGFTTNGVDGLAISPDLRTLYYSVNSARFLYSIPTSFLINQAPANETAAAVGNLGELGFTGGIAIDPTGNIYVGQAEQDGVVVYDPVTRRSVVLVRDKRINFAGRFSVAKDGFLYFTINQFTYRPVNYIGQGPLGVDLREKPYVLFRVPLPEKRPY